MRLRRVVLAAGLAGFGLAGWWSLRAGWADYWARTETVAGIQRALAAMPEQAEYEVRLAALVADSNPALAMAALRRALALNPLDARSWIDLGLREEAAGDLPGAEECLLRAAQADRKYLPRWTLANFYFRRDRPERFWFWAKSAAGMVYGDATPLFRLCGRVMEDGRLIERLDIRNAEVRAGYLAYLMGQGRLDLIAPATERLLRDRREADIPLLLGECERLIEARRAEDAIGVWNGLARTGGIHLGTLDPAKRALLTNGNFQTAPSSRGFDWRLTGADGVDAAREENPIGLRLTFSGQQAEQVEVLTQFVPAMEGTDYRLRVGYRTSGIAAGSGLRWKVMDLDGGILGASESLSSEAETMTQTAFRTPAGCRMVRVALVYQRAPGTTRIEGFAILRSVQLEPVDQLPDVPRSRPMK